MIPDAPWVGKCADDYYAAFEPKEDFDDEAEDIAYEIERDRRMEEES